MSPQSAPSSKQRDEDRKTVNASVNAFSRVIAVMVLMMMPGVIGYFLDKWLGMSFLIVVGVVIGMVIAVIGLVLVARQANEEVRKKK